ncbi:hypothetical protein [uncultured Tateyamaria sp.]|uniref:hypothetical protein n=1 Tax=uncultured Tateyamaria sp. TaxID=455651 RepID=UPI00263539C2|nr:hypothetical protein [uncultured Tateyamaria sp.]
MNLKASKTPLLIAAMATAVTLTTFLPANAKVYWASAEAESAQVIDANFKVKIKKHKSFKHHKPHHAKPYHGHHYKHGVKKKHYKSHGLKKKLILKKLF